MGGMRPSPYFGSVTPDSGLAGFGSSFKRAVRAPVKAVKKVAKPIKKIVPKPISKIASIGIRTLTLPTQMVLAPKAGLKRIQKTLKETKKVGVVAGAIIGIKPKAQGGGEEVQYTDANGNPISKAEYDKLMAAGGATEAVYQDENGNPISKAEYDRRMAEIAAGATAYADENGNPISKEEYDRRLAELTAAPAVQPIAVSPRAPAPQALPASGGGGGAPAPMVSDEAGPAESDTYEEGPPPSAGAPVARASAVPATEVEAPAAEADVAVGPMLPLAAPRRGGKGLVIGIAAGVAVLGLVLFLARRKG